MTITFPALSQHLNSYRKLVDTTITSTILGYEKNLTITVPYEWQNNLNSTFPVIVLFDRQNSRSHNYIIEAVEYMTENYMIPSCIIVGLESTQKDRYIETQYQVSDSSGIASSNEQFLFEELLPLIESKYHGSRFRLFIGHSRFGYFTSSLFLNHTEELNAVISMDPFFFQDNVDLCDSAKNLNIPPLPGDRFWRYAIGEDYPESFDKMEEVTSKMNMTNIDIKGKRYPLAEHNSVPGLYINEGLYEVFEKWTEYQNAYMNDSLKDISKIETYLDSIEYFYGNPLKLSLGALNGKGWQFYNNKEYHLAIDAWRLLLKHYPNFPDAYYGILLAKKEIGMPLRQTLKSLRYILDFTQLYSEEEKRIFIEELEVELGKLME